MVRPSGSSHSSGLWPGQIRDLSQHGVGLLLSRRFEPESRLIIELKDGLGDDVGMLLARVVRVAESSDTGWIMGCALINSLPESDVKFYLGAFLNC